MDRPCQSAKDCLAGETCQRGLCDDATQNPNEPSANEPNANEKKDESKDAEKKDEPHRESAQDAAPEAEPTTEAVTEPIIPENTPVPCQGIAPPSCRVLGLCQAVKPRCENGAWRCVYPAGFEEQEVTCDGQDNDCDGKVDEGVERPCYDGPAGTKGVGTCKAGTQRCEAGQWGACKGQVLPVQAPHDAQAESTCDGKDDDCDGQIDDGVRRACYTGPEGTVGAGVCRSGEQRCENGQWGQCVGEVVPSAEICDGQDNNCDGQVDEGLVRACYTGPSGTSGKGLCQSGTQACQGGQWGSCSGQVLPKTESCNTIDDDCDGQIDNGSLCGAQKVCQAGQCVCDTSKGYRSYNGGCIKDGDACPASLLQNGQVCLDADKMMICDPYGRIGIISCGSFIGSACVNYGGAYQGCQAPSNMDFSKGHMCQEFTADYNPQLRWQAIMKARGVMGQAVITFEHCVGGGRVACGYYINSVGYAPACLCGESSRNCGGTMRYDFSFHNGNACQWVNGNNFACVGSASTGFTWSCEKGQFSGFPYYNCR
ncbi:MAG: hypothetical protein H6727_19720 [Myxococcales bacterium]|nr:hypothetical protein [Myxococcales bacterium]